MNRPYNKIMTGRMPKTINRLKPTRFKMGFLVVFLLVLSLGVFLAMIPLASAIPCTGGCFQGANCCVTDGPLNGRGYAGAQDSRGVWHCPGSVLGDVAHPSVPGCAEVVCESAASCRWVARDELCTGCGRCEITQDDSGKPASSRCVPREGCEIAAEGRMSCLSYGQSQSNLCCKAGNEVVIGYTRCFSGQLQDPSHPERCYYGSQANVCDPGFGWTCRNSPVDTTAPPDCSFSDGQANFYSCAGKACGSTGFSCGSPVSSSTVEVSSCKRCSTSSCTPGRSYDALSEGCWSSEFSGCCITGETWRATSRTSLRELFMSQLCLDGYYQIRSQVPVTYYLLDVVIP